MKSQESILGVCLVAKSCPTLCNPMDCSPPGSSVHGISQARILEWVAIFFSREESILGTVSKTKEDYESENISRSFSLQKFSWFVPGKIWVGLENNLRCGRHFRRRTHEIWDLLDTGEEKKGQWMRTHRCDLEMLHSIAKKKKKLLVTWYSLFIPTVSLSFIFCFLLIHHSEIWGR